MPRIQKACKNREETSNNLTMLKIKTVPLWMNILFQSHFVGSNSDGNEILQQLNIDVNTDIKYMMKPPTTCSALDVWQEECSSRRIVSFCKELDDLLDGGVPMKMITELCGSPGSGKTQLCLQLCIDVQIPSYLGGLEGEAIYISTDSGFTCSRLNDMAEACLRYCQDVAYNQGDRALQEEISLLTPAAFLQGVHYIAPQDYVQLIATIYLIQDMLTQSSKIKIVVIDSLAFPFRDGDVSTLERTAMICRLLDDLQEMAIKCNFAVVITNQLTTRIISGKESELVPSLGDGFGHRVNQRLMLGTLHKGQFAAMLIKSSSCPQLSANFQIVKDGIRDSD